MTAKKAQRIMVPYFLFSVLSVVLEGIRLLTEGIFYWPHLRSLLLTTLTLQGNSVMWFLPALFLSEMFFLAIRKMAVFVCRGRKKPAESETGAVPRECIEADRRKNMVIDIMTIVMVVLFVGCVIWSNIFELSFYAGRVGIEKYERLHEVLSMLIRSCVCTFFVCFGYFARKYIMTLRLSSCSYGLMAVILLGICGVMNYINPGVDLRALDWGDSSICVESYYITLCVKAAMYLTGAVAGAMGILFFCRAVEGYRSCFPTKALAFFGANSLIIMATHLDFHVMHYCMELSGFLNGFIDHPIFYHVCLLIFVFAAEAVLILLINRYAPVLVGRYQRKRNFS